MDDPIEKFVHSTTKLSRLLQNAKFYDETFEDGIGIYFRREKEGIFRFQIPEGYGPLSGNYTSKELLQYFNNYKGEDIMTDKGFVRGTSNKVEDEYMVNLPPHIIEKMGWDIGEKVFIKTVTGKEVQNYVMMEQRKS